MKHIILLFIFATSLNAFSTEIQVQVEKAKPTGLFSVGIGSQVFINSKDQNISGEALFLGRALNPDGVSSYQMFLKDKKVFYIDSKKINQSKNLQTVVNPYEQAGGTCTAYAIFGFLQQLQHSGLKGNGKLSHKLADEKGRTNLLVDNVSEYYLTPQHRYSINGILNKYGKEYGFSCLAYHSESVDKIKARVLKQVQTGTPAIIEFNVGTEMAISPFELQMQDPLREQMDQRLWVPRKSGQRNGGGHTIVIAGAFELEHRQYFVTIDSDWSEPRVWDADNFLSEKTVAQEIGVVTCTDLTY